MEALQGPSKGSMRAVIAVEAAARCPRARQSPRYDSPVAKPGPVNTEGMHWQCVC